MSISLAFSGGKPCCNKKAGANKVSCKFNRTDIGINKDVAGELTTEIIEGEQTSFQCNSICANSCSKAPWWKFWAKKSTKNCPCKQANTTNASIGKS